jgi:glycosyltransferase involved in cell wall biosynthesis
MVQTDYVGVTPATWAPALYCRRSPEQTTWSSREGRFSPHKGQDVRVAVVGLHFAEYTSRLAAALAARHEVLLVLRESNARDELTPALRDQVETLTTLRYVNVRRWRDPRVLATSLQVNRIVRDFGPDVVHLQEVHPVLSAGTVLSLRQSMPVVLTVHDPVGHSGSQTVDSWQWKLSMKLRRRTTRVIVHGPRMREEIQALDPQLRERVDVIPHGILGQEQATSEVGESEPATFLFFGRIEIYKGLSFLLDAADILQARGVPARLIIAGTGTALEKHRTRIAASDCIELIDRFVPATDVPNLFRRATAAVLPYTDATQSGVAAIAIANCRPVIASNVGDLPDIVSNERTGLLVSPRDAIGLANAMERLIVDGSLRHRLASEAGRYARSRLSWSRIAELSAETYEHALRYRPERVVARSFAVDENR